MRKIDIPAGCRWCVFLTGNSDDICALYDEYTDADQGKPDFCKATAVTVHENGDEGGEGMSEEVLCRTCEAKSCLHYKYGSHQECEFFQGNNVAKVKIKKGKNKLCEMKIGESLEWAACYTVTRVPGGWLFAHIRGITFVPYREAHEN